MPDFNPLLGGATMLVAPTIPSGRNTTGVMDTPQTALIDGTPVRVVVLALAAAAGLTALKVAGFRFNVGVSN